MPRKREWSGSRSRRGRIQKRLRKRDGDFCKECFKIMRFNSFENDPLGASIDHIINRSEGIDPLDENNMELVHRECNLERARRKWQSLK